MGGERVSNFFIREVLLKTTQLEALQHFYVNTLGLPLIASSDSALTIQTGRSRLTFQAVKTEVSPVYHFAFNIPKNQLPNARDWLRQRVSLISDERGQVEFDFANWNALAVYFYDPAGNMVELIARQNLLNASRAPFDAASIFNISEIGIVVDDVMATAQKIQREMRLNIFNDSISDDFAALGSDEGLLIVVQRDRLWFPNRQIAAMSFETTILADGVYQTHRLSPSIVVKR
jgi:catechol-2,3-dioxygenase